MSKPCDPKVGHPPIKERPITEIVNRLPGKLIEQSETKGSKITYIVKFASEDSDEQCPNKFEVLDSKTGRSQVVSPSATAKRVERSNATTKKPEIDASITRSKRVIKTPKRLLDTESNLVVLKRNPTLDDVNRKTISRNVWLELPAISICKIDEKDLFIEVTVNSEFTVGPLEFKEEENGKSKYSCRVSGTQMLCEDSQTKVDSFIDSQIGESESICEDSFAKQVQDDTHILPTPANKESNEQNIHSFIEDANHHENIPKRQMKNKRLASPKKKITKSQKGDNTSMESSTEIFMESSIPKQSNESVEVITNTASELKNERKLTNSLEDTSDNFDDLDSEIRDMDEIENQTLAQPHAEDIQVKSEHKESQAPEPIEINNEKRKSKTKKAEYESRPKRKYTKRNAYSHDNTNYTVTTNETGKRVFKCGFCGIEMLTGGNIRDHIRTHTNDKPFQCSTCGKQFKTDNNLRGHMVIHSDARPHVCDICGLAFKQKGLLKIHRRRHDPTASSFTCQICGKGFYTSTEVKKHLPTHTGERKYECEVCGKKFKQDSALVRHRVIHLENKPFNCDICGKSFSRKNLLKDHNNRYHSSESNNNGNIDTYTSFQPINEIHVSFADEDAEAADQILDKDTLYVQFTQIDDGCQWPTSCDRDPKIVYQSLDIPTQHGEEIIIVAGSNDQQQNYQHHQI